MLVPPKRSRKQLLKLERQRRWKRRARAGLACATVDMTRSMLDLLVQLHWLRESDSASAAAVGRAVAAMWREAAKRRA